MPHYLWIIRPKGRYDPCNLFFNDESEDLSSRSVPKRNTNYLFCTCQGSRGRVQRGPPPRREERQEDKRRGVCWVHQRLWARLPQWRPEREGQPGQYTVFSHVWETCALCTGQQPFCPIKGDISSQFPCVSEEAFCITPISWAQCWHQGLSPFPQCVWMDIHHKSEFLPLDNVGHLVMIDFSVVASIEQISHEEWMDYYCGVFREYCAAYGKNPAITAFNTVIKTSFKYDTCCFVLYWSCLKTVQCNIRYSSVFLVVWSMHISLTQSGVCLSFT